MDVMNEAIVVTAFEIAEKAHGQQKRRDGSRYISHPMAVANLIVDAHKKGEIEGDLRHLVAVAYLHDVLEDTFTTDVLLQQQGVPQVVVDAVCAMTKISEEEYDVYLARVKANPLSRIVKQYDMLHNLSDQPSKKQVEKYTKGLAFLKE